MSLFMTISLLRGAILRGAIGYSQVFSRADDHASQRRHLSRCRLIMLIDDHADRHLTAPLPPAQAQSPNFSRDHRQSVRKINTCLAHVGMRRDFRKPHGRRFVDVRPLWRMLQRRRRAWLPKLHGTRRNASDRESADPVHRNAGRAGPCLPGVAFPTCGADPALTLRSLGLFPCNWVTSSCNCIRLSTAKSA